MSIQRKVYLYELLIRLGHRGFEAAQAIEIEVFMDGDKEAGVPSPIGPRPIEADELAPLIGKEGARLVLAAANAVAECQLLRSEVAAAKEAQATAQGAAAKAEGETIAVQAKLDKALAEIEKLKSKAK